MRKKQKNELVRQQRGDRVYCWGICNKIAVCFIVPVIFMIIIGIISYQIAADGLNQKYQDSTIQTIKMAREYLEASCSYVESEGMRLAFDSEINKYLLGNTQDPVEEMNMLNRINDSIWSTKSSNGFIQNIHIITSEDINIISTGIDCKKSGNLEEYEESVRHAAADIPKWIDSHKVLDEYLGLKNEDYILAYEAVADGNTGCVVIDMKKTEMQDFLAGLELGKGSRVGIVTDNGNELVLEQLNEDGEKGVIENEAVFADQDFYQLVSDADLEGAVTVNGNGTDNLFIYSRSKDIGLTICALVPMSVVTSRAESIKTITVSLVILAIIIVVLIGLMITSGIQKNLKRISDRFGEVAQGDLTIQISVKGRDEFQTLAKSATHMISNTKKLVNKVSGATLQLEASANDVEQVSVVITDCSQEITRAINEINDGICMQMEHAQKCVELTDVLSEDIREVSRVVESVENLVGETEQMIHRGMEIAESLGDKAKETTNITDKVSESISSLKSESEIINSLVDTITSISEQTNLLSLNASIEAARAGEAGRGFAVVAEEIRKLADDSAKAANQIQTNVINIGTQTEESVSRANQAKSMVELQTKAVEEAVKVFGSMSRQMKILVCGLKSIAENTDRADSERNNTVQAVKDISNIIEETAESAEVVRSIADKLLLNVNKLNKTADGLGNHMEGLKTEISVFKI